MYAGSRLWQVAGFTPQLMELGVRGIEQKCLFFHPCSERRKLFPFKDEKTRRAGITVCIITEAVQSKANIAEEKSPNN